jgi:hypothetical protein
MGRAFSINAAKALMAGLVKKTSPAAMGKI